MEAETLGHTRSDAHVLIETVTDSLAEIEAETLGDALSDAHAQVDTLPDLRSTGPHAG